MKPDKDGSAAGNPSPLGLVAGNRELPVMVARKAAELGRPLVIAAIEGEADAKLADLADHFIWIKLGQVEGPVRFFLNHGVRELIMIGGISRETLILNYEPDETAVARIEEIGDFHTDRLLSAVADFLAEKGLNLMAVSAVLPELLTPPGLLTSREPSPELLADLRMAWRMAKEMGRLDVGQTVVVAERLTLAVEAAEGTDEAVRRGAALAGRPAAVAKIVKPHQDYRLDPPVIGPETIKVMAEARVGALAVDASQTLIINREETVRLAEEAGLVLVAWTDEMSSAGKLKF